MRTITSRERLLATIGHSEPNRVPLVLNLFNYPQQALPAHLRHADQVQRAERFLAAGLDDMIGFGAPWRFHPDVRTRVWKEHPEGERYPLIHKVYETPRGPLMQAVKQTEDWPHGDDVEVISDFNIPRSVRFLVEADEDIDRLPYVLGAPSQEQVRGFRRQAQTLRREADRLGVALVGNCGSGGDQAMWLCGVENFMIACHERPAFAHRVLDIIQEWEMNRLRLVLETRVCDIVFRRGWYESPAFFSPPAFREFLFPRLKEEADLAHQAGCKFIYGQTVRPQDRIAEYLQLGIDALLGVDPVQGGADLARLKRECGDRICFFGGVNSYVTVGRGTRQEIRDAVRQAIDLLAPGGGFVLFPADAIDESVPWSYVEWLIEAWREWGAYPPTALV